MSPPPACSSRQQSQDRTALDVRIYIRNRELSSSLILDGSIWKQPFPVGILMWPRWSSQRPYRTQFRVPQRAVLHLPTSQSEALFTEQFVLWTKQSPADHIRFWLRVRSGQFGAANARIQKSQRLLFRSSIAVWENRKIWFQVQRMRNAFLSPFFLISLRA